MQFVFNSFCGDETLTIEGESFVHIFKARRTKKGEKLPFRNLKDANLYMYEVVDIGKKSAICKLFSSKKDEQKSQKKLNLAWCVVDPKVIEKTLPQLNEIGIRKINFIYSHFSQKNFKINLEKLNKILIYSCEQCGRADLMEFEIFGSIEEFLQVDGDFLVIDFSKNRLESSTCKDIKTFMIGSEGGYSKEERELLKNQQIVGLGSANILKSETAAVAVASKILL